ncbi:MAG: hypothetical protein J1F02_04005 [Lachnospiraceae bacterium]|nr:hypothetical protein [Lachnospiraceae bacterium]
MKKLDTNFEGITDTTGYLFSFAKCLSAALNCGGFQAYTEEIVASSGFAFRMWAAEDLCPSAMSIWEFKQQGPWVENGGITCNYVERLWGQEDLEEERRSEAVQMIQESIDQGVAAVVWDLSGSEWGLATGYDEGKQIFYTLKINGNEEQISYTQLGKLSIPILSVLTITGRTNKDSGQIVADTKALATNHLRGKEWCDNASGLAAYDTIIRFIQEKLDSESAWNLEYYLGTYAALKWYAWKFFEKYQENELAELYKNVYQSWQEAFDAKCSSDVTEEAVRTKIAGLLKQAKEAEAQAVEIMEL